MVEIQKKNKQQDASKPKKTKGNWRNNIELR